MDQDQELKRISALLEEGLTITEVCLKIGKPFSQVIALTTQDPALLDLAATLTANTTPGNSSTTLSEINYKQLELLQSLKSKDALHYCILRALSKSIDLINSSKSLYHVSYALKELSTVYKLLNTKSNNSNKTKAISPSKYGAKIQALHQKLQGEG